MKKIIECKNKNGGKYKVQEIFNGEIILEEKIRVQSFIINKDCEVYYVLYGNEMKPISDVFRFLNVKLANTSPNTKEKYLYALKYLYSYLIIFKVEFEDMNDSDVINLQHFLKGISPKGNTISLDLYTIRSNNTINSYFSVYRLYAEYLKIENSPFNTKCTNPVFIEDSLSGETKAVLKYKNTLRVRSDMFEVPKYISIEEFTDILKIIKKEYTKREECIVRLMYQAGLRIGEVLGLTADDIETSEYSNTQGIVYIRNRVTDSPWQRGKTVLNVYDKLQYSTKEYNTDKIGYQWNSIDLEIVDTINNYIEEEHTLAREKYNKNYYMYTKTDRVRPSEEYEDINYYIFLNSKGKPLTAQSWNKVLREIFVKANIKIDLGIRKDNLNHRFRHGYAMYLINIEKCDILEVKARMRHASLSSTMRYYNPTQRDIIQKKNKISETINKALRID